MKLYTKVKLADIKIQKSFLSYTPKKDKIDKYRDTYEEYKAFKKLPVVDKNLVLFDGYISYLLMKECGFDEVFVIKDMNKLCENTKNTMYIYGTHLVGYNDKVYIWRVPKANFWNDFRDKIKVGDVVRCSGLDGSSPLIEVKDIKVLDIPPRDGKICKIYDTCIYSKKEILEYQSMLMLDDILVRG